MSEATLTPHDVERLLKLVRSEHLEELGQASRTLPLLDQAIQASLAEQKLPDTLYQRGMLARQFLIMAVHALSGRLVAKNEAARRSYTLLNEFYVKAASRANTLTLMGLAGGSFDREKSLALAKLADSLYRILDERSGPESPTVESGAPPFTLPHRWTTFQAGEKGRYVPHRKYRVLWGRERELNTIIEILNQPSGQPVICVSGLGGSGKTALVRETVTRLLDSMSFAEVLWASAARQALVGSQIQTLGSEPLSFPALIDTLVLQVGLAQVANQDIETKKRALTDLFRAQPFLIVLDNWDESEDEVGSTRQLLEMVGDSKVLITTRHRQLEELPVVYPIHLTGLTKEDTARFLREESAARNVDSLSRAGAEYFQKVYELTSGAPLALNLVIGQALNWPLEMVLTHLQQASRADVDFYTFLFWQDWQVLPFAARKTLIYLGRMIRTSVTYLQLSQAGLVGPDSYEAIAALLNLSLVETNSALDEEERRYSLHPLVRQFVLSELPSQWSRQTS